MKHVTTIQLHGVDVGTLPTEVVDAKFDSIINSEKFLIRIVYLVDKLHEAKSVKDAWRRNRRLKRLEGYRQELLYRLSIELFK